MTPKIGFIVCIFIFMCGKSEERISNLQAELTKTTIDIATNKDGISPWKMETPIIDVIIQCTEFINSVN